MGTLAALITSRLDGLRRYARLGHPALWLPVRISSFFWTLSQKPSMRLSVVPTGQTHPDRHTGGRDKAQAEICRSLRGQEHRRDEGGGTCVCMPLCAGARTATAAWIWDHRTGTNNGTDVLIGMSGAPNELRVHMMPGVETMGLIHHRPRYAYHRAKLVARLMESTEALCFIGCVSRQPALYRPPRRVAHHGHSPGGQELHEHLRREARYREAG